MLAVGEASHDQVFVALIAALALLGATVIQNYRGFSRGAKERSQLRTAAFDAAEEAANGAAKQNREEMRSAVRDIEGQLAVVRENQKTLKELDRKIEILLARNGVILSEEPKPKE